MKRRRATPTYLIVILAIFVIGIFICIIGMNKAILSSAQLSGVEIARRFAANEMNYNKENEAVLNTLEIGLRPGNRPEDIPSWLREYLEYLCDATGIQNVEAYASIDGKIVAATYWEGAPPLNQNRRSGIRRR